MVMMMMMMMMMTMMMTTICCDVSALTVDGRLDVNVALNRPSYQSSVRTVAGTDRYAKYSNDGNRSSHVSGCSVTEANLHPWWAVDLVAALYVLGVKLTNRIKRGNTGLCVCVRA